MFKLRFATMKDKEFLWGLKNDPVVLANSYVIRTPVPKRKYYKWLEKTLEKSKVYIIEEDTVPVGDIRLDYGEEVEVSIRLIPEARGRGIGGWALCEAVCDCPPMPVVAYIIDGNIFSMRLFLKHFFVPVSYEKGAIVGRYKYVKE